MSDRENALPEAMVSDRENAPAYAVLPRSARRVFAAIERTIGDRNSASVSYVDFGSITTSHGNRCRHR